MYSTVDGLVYLLLCIVCGSGVLKIHIYWKSLLFLKYVKQLLEALGKTMILGSIVMNKLTLFCSQSKALKY